VIENVIYILLLSGTSLLAALVTYFGYSTGKVGPLVII
jgi:hypothetical protein